MFKIKVSGIKCDVCDYRDNSVSSANYSEYINMPCPKCGSPLLTQADYDTFIKVQKFNRILMPVGTMLFGFVLVLTILSFIHGDWIRGVILALILSVMSLPVIHLPVNMNGTGKIKLGKPKLGVDRVLSCKESSAMAP